MSIESTSDLAAMRRVSEAVAITLHEMKKHTSAGMTTLQLDEFGADMLKKFGARSAPRLTYQFPGWTCISVNNAFCHGIPSAQNLLKEGDLINIDVSAELDGYWADNGCSFVIGADIHKHQPLVNASKDILKAAISYLKPGMKISNFGLFVHRLAKKKGYKVIKNLAGHGVGKALHEAPYEIANYRDPFNQSRFKKNSVVAIETFIATHSTFAKVSTDDGWTMTGNKGGFMAQHEHTVVIRDHENLILTQENGI